MRQEPRKDTGKPKTRANPSNKNLTKGVTMCDRLNRLYDEAWNAYERARPFLAPVQAVWAVELMARQQEVAYRAVAAKMEKARENKMQELEKDLARLRELKKELAEVEARVKDAVIAAGETVNAPGIVVSYSDGRKTYDWKTAVEQARDNVSPEDFQAAIEKNTKEPTVDYKKVADAIGVVAAPFKLSAPIASIKLVDDEIPAFPDFPTP